MQLDLEFIQTIRGIQAECCLGQTSHLAGGNDNDFHLADQMYSNLYELCTALAHFTNTQTHTHTYIHGIIQANPENYSNK